MYATGLVTTFAGTGVSGGYDGLLLDARFCLPSALAFDRLCNKLLVLEPPTHTIRALDLSWGMVVTLAGNGTVGCCDGIRSSAYFNWPSDITCDEIGNAYVAGTFFCLCVFFA